MLLGAEKIPRVYGSEDFLSKSYVGVQVSVKRQLAYIALAVDQLAQTGEV